MRVASQVLGRRLTARGSFDYSDPCGGERKSLNFRELELSILSALSSKSRICLALTSLIASHSLSISECHGVWDSTNKELHLPPPVGQPS